MSRVVRTVFNPALLVAAFTAMTTLACTASTAPPEEEVSSTSEALQRCANGQVLDDCDTPCTNGYNSITHSCNPVNCGFGYHNVSGTCVKNPPPPPPPVTCPAGEVSSGGTCVPCGALNEPICNASSTGSFSAACTAAGTVSNGSQCVACGGAGEPACSAGNCTQNNTVDASGTCTACGFLNQPICTSASTPNFSTECLQPSTVAANGICVACGQWSQPICSLPSTPGYAGPCTQTNTAAAPNGTCERQCVFDPSCPPGMYNTTPPLTNTGNGALPCPSGSAACGQGGYVSAAAEGCTFTPPASASACMTTWDSTGTGNIAQLVPPFQAPVITSVVLGGSTVYGIGSPPPAQPGEQTGGANAVYAWGDNTYYQLGNNTAETATVPQVPVYFPALPAITQGGGAAYPALTVQSVVAGVKDACALLSDGNVYCWGTPVNNMPTPWKTATIINFPPDMTSNIVPGNPMEVAKPADPIVQITHGMQHACALTSSGHVYCWGDNSYAQLGAKVAVNGPPTITTNTNSVLITEVPLVTNYAANGSGVSAPGTVLSIAASGNTSCVLADESGSSSAVDVYCWGDNTEGSAGAPQLLEGAILYSEKDTAVGLSGTPTFLVGSSLGAEESYGSFCTYLGTPGAAGNIKGGWWCWGADDKEQFDFPSPASIPGANTFGSPTPAQLGLVDGVYSPTLIASATWLAIGATHSCAEGNATYCFGDNGYGELGLPYPGAGANELLFAGTPLPPPPSGFPGASFWTPLSAPPPSAGVLGVAPIAVGDDLTCGIYVSKMPTYNAGSTTGTPGAYGVFDSFGNPTGNATGNLACWGGGSSNLVSSYVPALLHW